MSIGENMVKRTVYFTVGGWQGLTDLAAEHNCSVSDLLRWMVEDMIINWTSDELAAWVESYTTRREVT